MARNRKGSRPLNRKTNLTPSAHRKSSPVVLKNPVAFALEGLEARCLMSSSLLANFPLLASRSSASSLTAPLGGFGGGQVPDTDHIGGSTGGTGTGSTGTPTSEIPNGGVTDTDNTSAPPIGSTPPPTTEPTTGTGTGTGTTDPTTPVTPPTTGGTGTGTGTGTGANAGDTVWTLIDAEHDQIIGGLHDGDVIDFSQLPSRQLSLTVVFAGSPGSVRFGVDNDSNFRLEQLSNWAIQGEKGGDYGSWTPSVGSHTVTATPYSGLMGAGRTGTPLVIHFTVVDSNPPAGGGGSTGGTGGGSTGGTGGGVVPPPTEWIPGTGNGTGWQGQQPAPMAAPIPADAIWANPGDDLNSIINSASAGSTVVLRPGAYEGGIEVSASNITVRAQMYGTVTINGTGHSNVFVENGGKNVVVAGITFHGGGVDKQDNDKAAVRTGDGWTITQCTVEATEGLGLGMFGSNVTVSWVTAQDNGRAGIGGVHVENGLMTDCISRRNNYKGDSNGGGGKFTRTDSIVVQRYDSYDNVGVGLWFDYSNINVTVKNSHIHDNFSRWQGSSLKAGAAGIFFEISGIQEFNNGLPGPILAIDNYVHDNDREGIQVWGTQNVTVSGNTLVNDTIALKDGRPDPYNTQNISVTGNTLTDTSITIDGDVASGIGGKNITIDGNIYKGSGALVDFAGNSLNSLGAAQGKGFEQTGTSTR